MRLVFMGMLAVLCVSTARSEQGQGNKLDKAKFTSQEISLQEQFSAEEQQLTAGLIVRPLFQKPSAMAQEDLIGSVPGLVCVKFNDGLRIRCRNGKLHDSGTGLLKKVLSLNTYGEWFPLHRLSEEEMADLRTRAMSKSGHVRADPNTEMMLRIASETRVLEIINTLNESDLIEYAMPWQQDSVGAPPPWQAWAGPCSRWDGMFSIYGQGYLLGRAQQGIGAKAVWSLNGGSVNRGGAGDNSRVLVIDYVLPQGASPTTPLHNELAHVFLDTPFDQSCQSLHADTWVSDYAHGVGVLGILSGLKEAAEIPTGSLDRGTIGIAYAAPSYFVSCQPQRGWPWHCFDDVGYAIDRACVVLRGQEQGSVIVISIQTHPQGSTNWVPLEYKPAYFNAIRRATDLGITVVDIAGNSGLHLDDVTRNVIIHPFRTVNMQPVYDSGAIIVGAGYGPNDSHGQPGQRCSILAPPPPLQPWASNYGSRVDLQGWGNQVFTAVQNTLLAATTPEADQCMNVFDGTSAAAPIVGGACALLQSVYYHYRGQYLTPEQVRSILKTYGKPQVGEENGGVTWDHIGPLPDVPKTILALLPEFHSELDCDGDGVLDAGQIAEDSTLDSNGDRILDTCQLGNVTGTVTGSGGQLLAGVQVELRDTTGVVASRTTAANGQYEFLGFASHFYNLDFQKEGYFGQLHMLTIPPLQSVTKNVQLVGMTGGLRGTVTDAGTNRKLSGVSIRVTQQPSTSTNPIGEYTMSQVPVGTYTVTASANGYPETAEDATIQNGQVKVVNFALTGGKGTIEGRVTSQATGSGLANVAVSASPGGYSTTTNSSGHYRLTDVATGTYTVTTSASGYDPRSQSSVEVNAAQTRTVDLVLPVTPGQINGTVLDNATNQPIASAEVVINNLTLVTDQNGSYSSQPVGGITPGTHSAVAKATDYFDKTNPGINIPAGQTQTVHFRLQIKPQPGTLSGVVTAVGGGPLEGARVMTNGGHDMVTDATGLYTFTGVSPGTYTLSVSATEYLPQDTAGVVVVSQQTTTQNFQLVHEPYPGRIEGHVRDQSQLAIVGATVDVLPGGVVTTDGNGEYAVETLPPGDYYRVIVRATGYATVVQNNVVVQENLTTTLDFTLELTGTITGVVRNDLGQPVAGASVVIPGTIFSTTADASGNYTLPNLRTGTYTVQASGPSLVTNSWSVSVVGGQTTPADLVLVRRSGISGTVKNLQNNPVEYAVVEILTEGQQRWTKAASDGSYTFNDLAPGSYALRAGLFGYYSVIRSGVVVVSGQYTTSNFQLQARQGVLYVDQAVSGGAGNGTSWANAFSELQSALALAISGDEIWVADGTYKPDYNVLTGGAHTGDRTASFEIQGGISVFGGFGGDETSRSQRNPMDHETILSGELSGSGENSYHVVTVGMAPGGWNGGTAVLDGFTIRGGNANGTSPHDRGGGVLCVGSGVAKLTDCRITSNYAATGAGVCVDSAALTLTNCTLDQNETDGSSGVGAGLYCRNSSGSSLSLVGCKLISNTATAGGGVYCESGAWPMLVNCLFLGNQATTSGGGGLYATAGSHPHLLNCVFSGNQAERGGALAALGASLTAANCSLSQNTASIAYGGGVLISGEEGAGSLTNCILWQNNDASGSGEAAQLRLDDGGTVFISYSCVQGWSGTLGGEGNIGGDPLFVDVDGADNVIGTADDNLSVARTSPVIDAGNSYAVFNDSYDLDNDGNFEEPTPRDAGGRERFADIDGVNNTGFGPGAVDMGALEVPRDCDNDGIPDYLEIEEGAPDCDGNGVLDSCEVASHDADDDLVIDACDWCNALSQSVWADLNQDGHVDFQDLGGFTACYSGPRFAGDDPVSANACGCVDPDAEGDVDMADFIRWQRCAGGSFKDPSPACEP